MLDDRSWSARAMCADAEPDTLFVKGAAQRDARRICFDCPVRRECLVEALNSKAEFGVWGGLTERERRALLRRHPQVTDWAAWLAANSEEIVAVPLGKRRRVSSVVYELAL